MHGEGAEGTLRHSVNRTAEISRNESQSWACRQTAGMYIGTVLQQKGDDKISLSLSSLGAHPAMQR